METLSAIQKTNGQTGLAPRSRGGAKPSAQKRPHRFDRYGFLKYRFLPFNGFCLRDWRKAETAFFQSVENICTLYEMDRPDVSGLSFPQNMMVCHQQIAEKLERKTGVTCRIMQDSFRPATLATTKRFDTGYTLYYIPVNAIAWIMGIPELKPLFNLLCNICAYFYQVIKIDYYRNYCYLQSTYSMIEDWINDDDEGKGEAYRDEQLQELERIKNFGDLFLDIIKKPFRVNTFHKVFMAYLNSYCCDKGFANLAMEIEKMVVDYPARSIYDSVPNGYYEFDETGNIHIEQYLSFYWSANDMFREVFFDMVNNDLNESGEQIEPITVQWFDTPQQQEQHNFDYEPRLFALIAELIDFLTDYDYDDKHHQ
ncbi:hypothetical protein [Mucilaginibacter rubeus]|uniref:hypothetical protein n=1 Tax=Mucilaginibacter rubeus TaxID=2027860 RepID=UPI00166CD36F|nr:hypothetical protein [Mucilaginibacter rubeus]